jgi:hypothetical protein
MHTASWPLANTAVVASSRASRYVNSRPESVAFAASKDSLSYCLFTLVNGTSCGVAGMPRGAYTLGTEDCYFHDDGGGEVRVRC